MIKRRGLFYEYLRIVEGLKPKWVVMENVTGITSVGGGQAVEEILSDLAELGYRVETGFCALRNMASRKSTTASSSLATGAVGPSSGRSDPRTRLAAVRNRLGRHQGFADAPKRRGSRWAASLSYGPLHRTSGSAPGNNTKVINHAAPRLAPINPERMKHNPEGGSWRDIPYDLLPAGMQRARRTILSATVACGKAEYPLPSLRSATFIEVPISIPNKIVC